MSKVRKWDSNKTSAFSVIVLTSEILCRMKRVICRASSTTTRCVALSPHSRSRRTSSTRAAREEEGACCRRGVRSCWQLANNRSPPDPSLTLSCVNTTVEWGEECSELIVIPRTSCKNRWLMANHAAFCVGELEIKEWSERAGSGSRSLEYCNIDIV